MREVKRIVPAILEKTLEEIKQKLSEVEGYEEFVQIDIEDNTLTKVQTYTDVEELNNLDTTSFIELDLIVHDPKKYIPSRPNRVTKLIFHMESDGFSRELLEQAQEQGFEIGLSVSPETPYEDMEPFLELAQSVQFMTVIPGAQGQKFVTEVLDKVREFKKIYQDIPIEVDGGINPETAKLAAQAGASIFVSGSYIIHCEDIQKCIYSLEESLDEDS